VNSLPDFPWDRLEPYAATARSHPDGIVNLSVGTPVDATPDLVQAALANAADAPGYPPTAGTPELRQAIAGWLGRRFDATVGTDAVLPVIGTKELVARAGLSDLRGRRDDRRSEEHGPRSDHCTRPRAARPALGQLTRQSHRSCAA
jgi:aspartate/methionine/tyrosine aminotransferase